MILFEEHRLLICDVPPYYKSNLSIKCIAVYKSCIKNIQFDVYIP